MNEGMMFFEVAVNELASLVSLGLGLTWGKGTLFEDFREKNSVELSQESQALAQDEDFQKLASIIAGPTGIVIIRTGGGTVAYEVQYLYLNRGDEVAVVGMTQEDKYGLILFENLEAFMNYWTSVFGGKGEAVLPNILSGDMTVEGLMFVLHCLDYYRINTYKDMLSYGDGSVMPPTVEAFADSMAMAMKSEDVRWLLPSLLNLLPGLSRYDFEIKADDIRVLMEKGLISGVDPTSGTMVYSVDGSALAAEFYRSWISACGMELWQVKDSGLEPLLELFTAPTALANHFFTISQGPEGESVVTHVPLSNAAYGFTLAGIVEEAYEQKALDSTEESYEDEVKADETSEKFCAHCGKALKPDAKFCQHCGNKVS